MKGVLGYMSTLFDFLTTDVCSLRFDSEFYALVKQEYNRVLSTLIEASSYIPFKEIWLFGSTARDEFQFGSDLDFLVIVEEPSKRVQVSRQIELLDVREDVGLVPVDVIVRTEEYILSGCDIFSREVLRDRVLLWKR